MLLQLFLAMLPAFALPFWYNRPGRERSGPLFICLVSAAAMLLCMLLSVPMDNGLDADLRTIPYIVGSLYGGFPSAAALAVLYAGIRLPLVGERWEMISLVMFLAVLVPLFFALRRTFRSADRKRRSGIAIGMQVLGALLLLVVIRFGGPGGEIETAELRTLLFGTILAVLLVWACVTLIERAGEQMIPYRKLERLSGKHRHEAERLRQLIAVAPLGIVLVDRDGIVTHYNDHAFADAPAAAVGDEGAAKDGPPVVGIPYTELSGGKREEAIRDLLRRALGGSGLIREAVEDGERVFLQTAFAVRDRKADELIGAAVLSQDISELTRLRDEINRADRLSLIGQMAAGITHEIRNPMAVIRGFVQLMSERTAGQGHEYYRIIIEELDRANGIINDFLSLAQHRIVEKTTRSLHDVLNELLPLLWADANLRGQTIELDLCEEEPMLEMNEREIKQMLLNLARNGMEAMGEKGVLRIATRHSRESIELSVADTGPGIPEEKLRRLFEPFYTTKARGTGLGLPLSKSIAERHNGRIEAVTEAGVGTTFIVTFHKQAKG